MLILRSILIIIEVLSSLLLIGLILIQKSKSEGLGLAFGSGMGESLFGSRAGNVLTKMTIILGTVFMANTLVLALVYSGAQEQSLMAGDVAPAAATQPVAPSRPAGPPTLPSAPAAPSATPAAAPAPSGIPTLPGANLADTPLTVEPIEADEPAGEEAGQDAP